MTSAWGQLCGASLARVLRFATPRSSQTPAPVTAWGLPAKPHGRTWPRRSPRCRFTVDKPYGQGERPPTALGEALCVGDNPGSCSPGCRPRGPSPPRPLTPGKRIGLRRTAWLQGHCMGTGKGLGCSKAFPSLSHAALAPGPACGVPCHHPGTRSLRRAGIMANRDVRRMGSPRTNRRALFAPSQRDALVRGSQPIRPQGRAQGDGDRTQTVAQDMCPHPMAAAVPFRPTHPPPAGPRGEGAEMFMAEE